MLYHFAKNLWKLGLVLMISLAIASIILTRVILPQYTSDEEFLNSVTMGMTALVILVGVSLVIAQLVLRAKILGSVKEDFRRIRIQSKEIATLPPYEYLKERAALEEKIHQIHDKYIPDETPSTSKE